MDNQDKLIENIYNHPSKPGAFLGAQKIHKVLKNSGHTKPGIYKIRKWLQNQDDYSLQKPVRRNFKRAKVLVSKPKEQLDIDLADMQSLLKYNDNVKYLLVVIDVFTRYAWVEPLKNKTANEVERKLVDIVRDIKPRKIRTDGGAEFNNKWVKQMFERNNIYHHVTLNEVKANYVERFIRTLKTMIYRYFTNHKTQIYIDVLPQLVETYNATPHRSLNNIAPKDVNEQNVSNVWAYMYLKPQKSKKTSDTNAKKFRVQTKRLYKYKIGQLVRISHQRKVFTRAYNEQWSYEVFKINKRFQMQSIPMYKLVDLLEDQIKGYFYQSELQVVNKKENTLWSIEKIIRKRRRKNSTQYLVKWTGYSNRFNSWIDETEVKNA